MTPPGTSALARLLARLMATDPDAAAPLPSPEDLPDELVRRHGLSPLAYRAGIEKYRNDFLAAAVLAVRREKLLAEAIQALRSASVPVVLLKGISYAVTLYEDPGERPMSDIDLLVPGHRHARALQALGAIGYADCTSRVSWSRLHHAFTLRRGDSMLDLHRTIIQPLRSRLDLREIWARAQPAAERSDGALRLEPVDETLFHLVHIARHELVVPTMSYVDAVRLLARLGPAGHQTLLARARQARLSRAVETVLQMTETLAGAGDALSGAGPIMRRLMADPGEILAAQRQSRPLQFARKALLLEGPVELLGLAAVVCAERLAAVRAARH